MNAISKRFTCVNAMCVLYMGEVDAALGALKVGGGHVFQVVASPLCTSTPEVDRVQESVSGSRLCALHGILTLEIHTLHTLHIHYIYFSLAGEEFGVALVYQCCSKQNINTQKLVDLFIILLQ